MVAGILETDSKQSNVVIRSSSSSRRVKGDKALTSKTLELSWALTVKTVPKARVVRMDR